MELIRSFAFYVKYFKICSTYRPTDSLQALFESSSKLEIFSHMHVRLHKCHLNQLSKLKLFNMYNNNNNNKFRPLRIYSILDKIMLSQIKWEKTISHGPVYMLTPSFSTLCSHEPVYIDALLYILLTRTCVWRPPSLHSAHTDLSILTPSFSTFCSHGPVPGPVYIDALPLYTLLTRTCVYWRPPSLHSAHTDLCILTPSFSTFCSHGPVPGPVYIDALPLYTLLTRTCVYWRPPSLHSDLCILTPSFSTFCSSSIYIRSHLVQATLTCCTSRHL